MKTKLVGKKKKYDGSQLRSLFGYLEFGVLGNSVICFRGPCSVNFSHMIDGEDLLSKSKIQGDDMVHFIFELFERELHSGVLLQRLFASIMSDLIFRESKGKVKLERQGDDLYLGKKKLSISIATRSTMSTLVHFAVNVTNKGTPVPTLSLEDLKLNPQQFSKKCLELIQKEWNSIEEATCKVRAAL